MNNRIKRYNIANHIFEVVGNSLVEAVSVYEGFKPFLSNHTSKVEFYIKEGENGNVPQTLTNIYDIEYENVHGTFAKTSDGYRLTLKPMQEEALYLWRTAGASEIHICGNFSLPLLRFALWVGYGLMTVSHDTLAIHSSCIVYKDKAVLFLGESGTGKSTHTRLWCEHIPGAILLNDDSPIIRVENEKIWVYGSAWSGKTPCYKNERYELASCVRLSQSSENSIFRLPTLQAYGAVHPSCPPEFAYDNALYDSVSRIIGTVISKVPVYGLACLPNRAAAELSYRTIFG